MSEGCLNVKGQGNSEIYCIQIQIINCVQLTWCVEVITLTLTLYIPSQITSVWLSMASCNRREAITKWRQGIGLSIVNRRFLYYYSNQPQSATAIPLIYSAEQQLTLLRHGSDSLGSAAKSTNASEWQLESNCLGKEEEEEKTVNGKMQFFKQAVPLKQLTSHCSARQQRGTEKGIKLSPVIILTRAFAW